jgi:hypothetical protein
MIELADAAQQLFAKRAPPPQGGEVGDYVRFI